MAGQGWPLHRPRDIVLRIRLRQAAKNADEDRPLFALAGLWTPWRGVRGPKSAPVDGNHELFGFLTTEANAVVAPIHPKAMPVILTSPEEADRWLEAETADALALQRPLPDDALRIVAKGEKEDAPPHS
jgi:putative SOS response-associated peptidase YedK